MYHKIKRLYTCYRYPIFVFRPCPYWCTSLQPRANWITRFISYMNLDEQRSFLQSPKMFSIVFLTRIFSQLIYWDHLGMWRNYLHNPWTKGITKLFLSLKQGKACRMTSLLNSSIHFCLHYDKARDTWPASAFQENVQCGLQWEGTRDIMTHETFSEAYSPILKGKFDVSVAFFTTRLRSKTLQQMRFC